MAQMKFTRRRVVGLVVAVAVLVAAGVVVVLVGGGGDDTSWRSTAQEPAAVRSDPTRTVDVPASIDATGKADVASALDDFLAGVPDHSTVRFAQGGRYRVEDVVSLTDRHDITLDGNGATLFQTTTGYRERNIISLVSGSDLVVRDFHLVGVSTKDSGVEGDYIAHLEGQHGVRVRGTERVLIEDNTIEDVHGDFVYLGADQRKKRPTWRDPARDVTVRDNVMHSNGRQGIAFTACSRVLVQHNRIGDVRRTVFDLEPGGKGTLVEDVTIDRNTVGEHHNNLVSAGGDGSVNDVAVTDNQLRGGVLKAVIKNRPGATRRNWLFAANHSDSSMASGLKAAVVAFGVTGIRVVDNVQPMKARPPKIGPMAGLRIGKKTCDASASGNTFGKNPGPQMIGTSGSC